MKFARLYFLFLLLLGTSSSDLEAQNRRAIDSLQNELQKFESYKKEMGSPSISIDSTKTDILYRLAFVYWGTIPDSGIYYARQVLSLSEQIRYGKGIGNAYNVMGLCNMQMKNYPVAMDYYQKALNVRIALGDKKGIGAIYNNLGLMYGNMGEIEESIKSHTQALKIREETGDSIGMEASYGKIGKDYFNMGNFPEAVSNFLKALKIEEEIGDKPQIIGTYHGIGDIYFSVGNYPEALKNYKHALKIANEIGDKGQVATADIDLGRICYKQSNDTGAIKFLLASLKIMEEGHVLWSMEDIHYNLGLVYLDMGNYSLAQNYADSSLMECQIMGSQPVMVKIYIELGSIYEKQGKLQDALDVLTKGLSLAKKIGAKVDIRDAYSHLADVSAEMKNYSAAYEFYKDYTINLDSINSNESAKKIAVLEINYAFQKKQDSVRVEQEKNDIINRDESNLKSIITDSAVVISVLTILMAFLLINRQQLKHKKDKIIFEKDKKQMESELTNAKIMLDEYIQTMAEKNKLLEEFKTDMEGLKSLYDKERIAKLEYLNKANILTDEDWNKFKQLFEQVHKDFLKRVKEKLPDLTQAEIRLVCLTKLSVGTKQMAGILGVSFDTIKKSRHRLRKKLGLSEEDSIDDIVSSI